MRQDDYPQDEHTDLEPSSTGWLVIFSDLISLLLAFFVLMYSMSSLQFDRWPKVVNAVQTAIKYNPDIYKQRRVIHENIDVKLLKRGDSLSYLQQIISEAFAQSAVLSDSYVYFADDRLVISIRGDKVFDADQYQLTTSAQRFLYEIANLLDNAGNKIIISISPNPEQMQDAKNTRPMWELALARAVSVVDIFRQVGLEQRMDAFVQTRAYGDHFSDTIPVNAMNVPLDITKYWVNIVLLSTQEEVF